MARPDSDGYGYDGKYGEALKTYQPPNDRHFAGISSRIDLYVLCSESLKKREYYRLHYTACCING